MTKQTIQQDYELYQRTGEYDPFFKACSSIIKSVMSKYSVPFQLREDLAQDIQIKIFLNIHKIKEGSNPFNFVWTLAKNFIIDFLKSKERAKKKQLIIVDYPIELVPDTEQIILKKMEVFQDWKEKRRIVL